MAHAGYTLHNRVRLITGGKEYFSLLHEIVGRAVKSVYLQYYIFDNDETGSSLKLELEKAAARGVAVFLLVDGYASQKLPGQFVAELRQAGVKFKWFEPLFRSKKFYFGRRMHHKVVVADGLYSLVGGINICNRYNDLPGKPGWLDTALYCEGEAASELYQICRQMWGTKPAADDIQHTGLEKFLEAVPEKDFHSVRVRQNDWVKRKNEVWKSYMYMFLHAKEYITIMCSYFLPGRAFRKAMSKAVKRGVRINVILAGPSDVMVAKHAERYLYDWLLKNNIGIYEYQKTVLHAKMAVYDDRWVTVGSYNVNNISAYASLEMNLDVRNKPFAADAAAALENIIRHDCKKITRGNYRSTASFFRRLWQRICYRFINSMLSLFTFYYKQEE